MMPRQRTSLMWTHFEEIPGQRARCDHCLEYLSIAGGSLGNLKRHLLLKHPTVGISNEKSSGKNETPISAPETGTAVDNLIREAVGDAEGPELELARGRKKSQIWSYFKVLPHSKAKCQLCCKDVSITSGSTGNLIRHLKLRHPTAAKEAEIQTEEPSDDKEPEENEPASQEDCDTSAVSKPEKTCNKEPVEADVVGETNKRPKKRSLIWSHFNVVDKGRAKCVYCSSKVGFGHGSTGNLTRHLRTKHQRVVARGKDMQLVAANENEPIVIDLGNFEAFSVGTSENLLQTELVEVPQFEKCGLYDLCIIGSGLFGSAAARHASADPSFRVVVIGLNDNCSDCRKCAKLFYSYHEEESVASVIDEQQPLQKLVECSINRFEELERISGKKFYFPKGFMAFGRNGHPGMEEIKRAVALGNVPVYYMQNIVDLSSRFPCINFNIEDTGFLESNSSGCISIRNLLEAQRKVSELQGCNFVHDIVKDVSPAKKFGSFCGHEITLGKGSSIYAKRVLICTGAFTKFSCLIPERKESLPMLGVVRETAALFEISAEEASKLQGMPVIKCCSSPSSSGVYFLPPVPIPEENPEDLYYIKAYDSSNDHRNSNTSNEQDICDWYLSEGSEETLESLLAILNDMLPDLKVHSVKSSPFVTCHTASSVPYINRMSPTVTLAVGGGSRSAACSDEVGRIASQLSLTGRWDSEVPQLLFNTIWEKT